MIYLDNNATTMVAPEVREAMAPYFSDDYGNPSSLHGFGKRIRRAVEEARSEVAKLLGTRSERELIFTSGGTESNHTAILSALRAQPGRRRIVTSQVEHSSVKNFCGTLQKDGYEVISIGVSRTGSLDWKAFEETLTDQVAVVSIMWANNETGVLFPIERIAQTVKEKGILLHIDAVQATGKIKMRLRDIPLDYLSVSTHKFHGPKGIGVLYICDGSPFHPLFVGGRQERDRRAGTENVSGIIGLACALRLAINSIVTDGLHMQALRDSLEVGLLSQIPESFANGRENPRIPNTTNITIPGVEAETLLIRLSDAGIAASSGSACLTGALEPSHVLKAMGHSEDLAFSSLRFSLSRFTTASEIDMALRIIPGIVRQLRQLSEVEKL